jgi:polyribonucleotide nucleotidyltransferase
MVAYRRDEVRFKSKHMHLHECSSGFVKRDGRPKESETLVSRLVDRSLRPAFAPGWTYDTQVRECTDRVDWCRSCVGGC